MGLNEIDRGLMGKELTVVGIHHMDFTTGRH